MHGCTRSRANLVVGRNSSVGKVSRYRLDGPGIESWWGASFFAHVQNGSGAHPVSYTISTESFAGAERTVRNADHPLPSTTEIKERLDLYLNPILDLQGLF